MRALRWLLIGRTDGLRTRALRRLRQQLHPGPIRPAVATPPAPPPPAQRSLGGAPEGYQAVARMGELEEGVLTEVFVRGRSVALVSVAGEPRAFEGVCPHAGGPLADGQLDGATIRCPMHGWSFDISSGDCHVNPEDRIRILGVRVVGDVVCVEI
jgi:nitrite reductase/ring-hydroxylating ferredoxin subunit